MPLLPVPTLYFPSIRYHNSCNLPLLLTGQRLSEFFDILKVLYLMALLLNQPLPSFSTHIVMRIGQVLLMIASLPLSFVSI
jgi:hypothetical protein